MIRSIFASFGILILAYPSLTSARQLELIYTGAFNTKDAFNLANAPTTPFGAVIDFTAEAFFDTSSPDLVAPIGQKGFVAYSPSKVVLSFNGKSYDVASSASNAAGVSVSIFDRTTPFGVPDHYAIGLIQNPLADGAGFVGDFVSANPDFTATDLGPTTFTNYFGVGFSSGVSTVPGNPGAPHEVTPIPVSSGGEDFLLTLGTYDENAGDPNTVTNTAQLLDVPEPTEFGLALCGLALICLVYWRRSRVSQS